MFITFEGPDGSGKTTAIEGLEKYLKSINIDYLLTREPGTETSNVNKQIREIILNNENDISPMGEAILFSADRRMHLETLIWPALKEGQLVLCDRYFDSTFAYQGFGRNLGLEKMIDLQVNITDSTFPDVTIYFDLPIDVAIGRVDKRGEQNRLDKEGIDFVKRVHDGYKAVIKKYPKRFEVVDASKSPDEVLKQVIEIFTKRILTK